MPLILASTLLYMKSIVTRQVVSTGPLQRDWGTLVPDSAAAGSTFRRLHLYVYLHAALVL